MLLKVGSKGEDVKKLQQKLGLKPDGIFGFGTQAAVKKLQKSLNLCTDGIVGEDTWNKLFATVTNVKKDIVESATTNNTHISIEKLRGHIPDSVIELLPETMKTFKINTPLRLAHFLAQCGHESNNFKVVQENLKYSRDGLMRIFPRYFPGNLAESYALQPEKIASRVYGSRMGNGPEESKEGYKFRGRGFIQLTGKSNYKAFGDAINVDVVSNPDLVSTKYPLLSAAWFFNKNCLAKCDAGASDAVVTSVTRCVNGGTIGLPDRIKHFKIYYKLLS